jgi:hypothetical protein
MSLAELPSTDGFDIKKFQIPEVKSNKIHWVDLPPGAAIQAKKTAFIIDKVNRLLAAYPELGSSELQRLNSELTQIQDKAIAQEKRELGSLLTYFLGKKAEATIKATFKDTFQKLESQLKEGELHNRPLLVKVEEFRKQIDAAQMKTLASFKTQLADLLQKEAAAKKFGNITYTLDIGSQDSATFTIKYTSHQKPEPTEIPCKVSIEKDGPTCTATLKGKNNNLLIHNKIFEELDKLVRLADNIEKT